MYEVPIDDDDTCTFQLQNWSRVCGPAALPDDGALRLGLLEDLPPDVRLRREALQQWLPDAQEELRENGSLGGLVSRFGSSSRATNRIHFICMVYMVQALRNSIKISEAMCESVAIMSIIATVRCPLLTLLRVPTQKQKHNFCRSSTFRFPSV